MPATYEKIQSTTLTSTQSVLSFSSVSNNYTDIVIAIAYKSASTNNPTLRLSFNSSNSGYSGRQLYGNPNSVVTSNNNTNASFISIARSVGGPTAVNGTAAVLIHLMDYASTTKYKTIFAQVGNADPGGELDVGVWANTSAINQISIDTGTGNDFAAGTVITLYGIKAA